MTATYVHKEVEALLGLGRVPIGLHYLYVLPLCHGLELLEVLLCAEVVLLGGLRCGCD